MLPVLPERDRDSFLLGLIFGVALSGLAVWALMMSVQRLGILLIFGALQWTYILPLFILLRLRQQTKTATGLLIVPMLLMVANVAWWVLALMESGRVVVD